MSTRLAAIGLNTCRELIHQKVLYNLLLFALLFIAASVLLARLTVGDQGRIVLDLGLAGMNMSVVLMAIFLGVTLINSEIERRTIVTVLTTPVRRAEYLLGRFLGLIAILLINLLVMLLAVVAVCHAMAIAHDARLLIAVAAMAVEAIIMAAIAVFLSTVTTAGFGSLCGLAAYGIGHLTGDVTRAADHLEGMARDWILGLSYLLPNLEWFNLKGTVVRPVPMSAPDFVVILGYGLSYSLLVLVCAMLVFERKDVR